MPGTLPSRTGCGTLNHIWVLAINPDAAVLYGLEVGVIGAHPGGAPEAFEVRAFATSSDSVYEDPVTGSLNASLGQWLIKTGQAAMEADLLSTLSAADRTAFVRALSTLAEPTPEDTGVRQ